MLSLIKKTWIVTLINLITVVPLHAVFVHGSGPNGVVQSDKIFMDSPPITVHCPIVDDNGKVIGSVIDGFVPGQYADHKITIQGGSLLLRQEFDTSIVLNNIPFNPLVFPEIAANPAYMDALNDGATIRIAIGDHRLSDLRPPTERWVGTGKLAKADEIIVRCVYLVDPVSNKIIACVNCLFYIHTHDDNNQGNNNQW